MKRNKNIIAKFYIAAGFYCFNLTSCTKDDNKEDVAKSKAKKDFLERLKNKQNLPEEQKKQYTRAFEKAIDPEFSKSIKKILKLSDEDCKKYKSFKDLSDEQQKQFVENFVDELNSLDEKKLNNEEDTNKDILDSILDDNEVADEDTQDDQDEVSSSDDDSKTEKTDSSDETSDKDKKGPEVKQSIDEVFNSIANTESLDNILKNFDRFDSSKGKQLFLKVKVGSEYIYINLKAFSILCEVLNNLYKEEKSKSRNLIPELNLLQLKSDFGKCNANIYVDGFNNYNVKVNSKKFSQIGGSDFFSLENSNTNSLLECNYLLKMMVDHDDLGFSKECLDSVGTLSFACIKKNVIDNGKNVFDNDGNYKFGAGDKKYNLKELIGNFLK